MIKNQKIIAIIPARGGSKGLPGKNIKPLLGKPLIAWTIEKARSSKYIDRVFTSTDDKKIAEVSKKYGVEIPFLRPAKMAKDKSPVSEAIMHALSRFEEMGERFDILIILEPTSPLRKDNDIDNAIELFARNMNKADSLVSCGEVRLENPFIMKKIEKGYANPLIKISKGIYQRQQLPKAYFPYGVIYLSKVDSFKKYGTVYQKRTIPYLVERWENYEIDDIYDFLCVEAVLKNKLKDKK